MKFVKAPHPSSGHYCAGVISNGMLYISGQTSADPFTGKAPEGGIEAEVNMCLTRISHILESAGIDKTHVVMCRIYLKDMSFWKEVNRVYGEFLGDHTPARAVYGVSQIHHGVNIEMEVVAEM